ncbi:BTB/POZ domain-containing protein At5g48130 [Telopea speciosissima]|uniref:BTB/POZ domain-containing protein At5g48130 n=1 Tax=Telopea speciosissima TaxID=54955 RepID=UPI001CC6E07B|nr:BTB/POZ domain-containing protein At5g48130 [Telopea speciosissima]
MTFHDLILMDVASPKVNPPVPSPFSSPNVAALLKIKIIAWSQETGLPVSVRVLVDDKVFELHKYPLLSKSGYFKKALNGTAELELPHNFPGGSKVFAMIALFSYGFSAPIDPFNVAALRCAAEFLEMTEDYDCGNLCERTDLYLNQVALQSWDDTLIVLQKCQTLLPWSEELLIVSRCLESLAFMACMEILDPERRRERPVVTLDALANRAWSFEAVKEIAGQDLWIKDLIALPFEFFKRIIGSLRRQGMKEKYVSPLIVFYANKWVLSKKTNQFWLNMDESDGAVDSNNKVSAILQGILDLLPMGKKASRVIPIGFYFALLSKAINIVGLRSESKTALQDQIVSLLQMAQVDDFLLPGSGIEAISSSMELVTMESIVSSYVSLSSNQETNIVAELWDSYLSRIASDPKMGPRRFMDLIEIIPISDRQNHDHLYRAMSNYLSEHLNLSQEEKASVCKYLNCQKLSQETCIEAVQNEFLPLRLIVQALFVQQLNTHKAFKDCSDSFRYVTCGDLSGSLSSSIFPNTNSQNLGDHSPYKEAVGESNSRPLGFLLQKDVISRKDYESTSFRIQNLEQELMSLKRSLRWQMVSKESEPTCVKPQSISPYGLEGRTMSKKKNPLGQVTSCIGSVSFASQRKYANSLLKVFRRLVLLGKGKSKTKKSPSSLWTK